MKPRLLAPSRPGSGAFLAQSALAVLLVLLSFGLGHWKGTQDAAARPSPQLSVAVGAAAAAAAAATTQVASTQCATDQVDFAYDVASHLRPNPGPKGWPPPLRRPRFKPPENSNQGLYDSMWTAGNKTYQRASCWGCRFVMDVVQRLDFDTVLDAGTGNGGIVRVMRLRGKAAWGIELSRAVLERDAPDLLAHGLVEQGSLTALPYQDSQFDLVFSADVLEHIRPEEADAVVTELVRVARRHIVLSISLKSWQNDGRHTLLRPRAWWEAKFAAAGAVVNQPLLWAMQNKEIRFSRERGGYRECRWEGEEGEGGKYEVCVVDTTWLVGRPGQEVRKHRCITPANAEMEPWIFAFTVDKGDGNSGSGKGEAQRQQRQPDGAG